MGAGYKEIAPGVFRSADGARQFRMTNADILGRHGDIGSHVHFEALNNAGESDRKPTSSGDAVMRLRAKVRSVSGETTHLQSVRQAGEIAATPSPLAAIPKVATFSTDCKSPGEAAPMGRVLGVADSRIAASAVREGAPVITNDGRFARFLRAVGIEVGGF